MEHIDSPALKAVPKTRHDPSDPGMHPRESERLGALADYDVINGGPEPEFDAITRFAAELCGTPTAIVSLVGAEFQYAKSVSGVAAAQTPRVETLCAHSILSDELMIVPDTQEDLRFTANPHCQQQGGVRFYAAAPLMTRDKLPIGVLCVIDTVPRDLSTMQRGALTMLAGQVMAQLDLRRAIRDQRVMAVEADHRIKNSLQMLAAMVRFQGRTAQADETRDTLAVVQGRIEAMGLLHEMLQAQHSATAAIDLRDYLLRIIDFLKGQAPPGVAMESRLIPLRVSSSSAASIGMIVSEWVANAFKHGFPDGRGGTVEVSIVDTGGGTAQLQVADDGVGVKPEGSTPGLGSQIIVAAMRNIDATSTADADESGLRQRLLFAP